MGFSTSGALAVVFVGVLLAVGVLYPSAEAGYERVVDATEADEDRTLRMTNSEIRVTNVTYQGDDLTVDVDNTGSVPMDVDRTDLVVDGVYVVPDSSTVDGDAGRTVWAPGEQLSMTVENVSVATGRSDPDRVKVVVETGVSDTETGV